MGTETPTAERAALERAMRAIGERIESAIGSQKIAPIARAVGMKRENLSAAKSGTRLLTARQLVDLAAHLKVDLEDLLPTGPDALPVADRLQEARLMWAGRKNLRPRLVDPPMTGGSSTLEPGQRRAPGLDQWLEKHWQDVTYRQLWNLERWVAQDALNPESEDYWDDTFDYIKRRLAARDSKTR